MSAVTEISAAAWDALRADFKAHNQSHVFQFYDQLTAPQRAQLYSELKSIDLKHVMGNFALIDQQNVARAKEVVAPFPHTTVAADLEASHRTKLRADGLTLIAAGKVCAILMAGGQGTRLGSDRPKGCYDIGLPSGKSLFQLQAERIVRLKQLAAQHTNKNVASVSLPWYVMTSPQTDKETKEFFAAHSNWGLPTADVMYFEQANLPCLTPKGAILMETTHSVCQAPNGNGGVYAALKLSGCLQDMKKRGVLYSHFYGVDNALVKVADPEFLAFCVEQKADCANKVVLKRDWSEKVGVMCLRDNKSSVIEYSEISTSQAQSTDAKSGRLLFGAANIVQHFFTVQFLEQIANDTFALPFHVATKKIPSVDPKSGLTVAPAAENGIKLEMFVFDSFASANRCVAYAVPRESEFTAVKNAAAPGVLDSPATARLDISRYHQTLIARYAPACTIAFNPNAITTLTSNIERLAVLAVNPASAPAALATALAATAGKSDIKHSTATATATATAPTATTAAVALSNAATNCTLFELSPLLTYDGADGLSNAFAGRVFLTPCNVEKP